MSTFLALILLFVAAAATCLLLKVTFLLEDNAKLRQSFEFHKNKQREIEAKLKAIITGDE